MEYFEKHLKPLQSDIDFKDMKIASMSLESSGDERDDDLIVIAYDSDDTRKSFEDHEKLI